MFVPGLRSIQFLSQSSSQSSERVRRKVGISLTQLGFNLHPKLSVCPSTEILAPAPLYPVQDGEAELAGTPGHAVEHYFTPGAVSTAQRNTEKSLGKAGRRQQGLVLLEAEGPTPLQAVRLCRTYHRFQGGKHQGSELKPVSKRKELD